MKYDVIVVGGGVVGVTTAFYLWERGYEVAVVERHPECSEETSFANGCQISVSHAEPWAHPGAQWQVAKWLLDKNSPLYFKPQADLHQLKWIYSWLKNCSRKNTDVNTSELVRLALESRRELIRIRRRTKIDYNHLTKGIIHYYTDQKQFEGAMVSVDTMRRTGLLIEKKSTEELCFLEPSLIPHFSTIVGGTYAPYDESGDCNLFTKKLANFLESNGVRFFYNCAAVALKDNSLELHQLNGEHGFVITSKKFVISLGSFTYQFVKANFKKDYLIYPCKGSSVTVPIIDNSKVPTISLTDDENKIVYAKLGNRLRIAGTAELAGWNGDVNVDRCKTIQHKAMKMFEDGCDWSKAMYWSGLRPTTPSNVPYIEKITDNVIINSGHGTLGWTLACGSGKRVMELISK